MRYFANGTDKQTHTQTLSLRLHGLMVLVSFCTSVLCWSSLQKPTSSGSATESQGAQGEKREVTSYLRDRIQQHGVRKQTL